MCLEGVHREGAFSRDVDKTLHHTVTVARREQNASCDVNRMADLLWLYCRICFGSVARHPSKNSKNAGAYAAFRLACAGKRNGNI